MRTYSFSQVSTTKLIQRNYYHVSFLFLVLCKKSVGQVRGTTFQIGMALVGNLTLYCYSLYSHLSRQGRRERVSMGSGDPPFNYQYTLEVSSAPVKNLRHNIYLHIILALNFLMAFCGNYISYHSRGARYLEYTHFKHLLIL